MIYYFKKAHKFGFLNGFVLHEKDAEEWRENWVFRFWTITYCFETKNGDLFFHHHDSFIYKTQQTAMSGFNGFKSRGLKPVLA